MDDGTTEVAPTPIICRVCGFVAPGHTCPSCGALEPATPPRPATSLSVEPALGGDADIAALYAGQATPGGQAGDPGVTAAAASVRYHAGSAPVLPRTVPVDPWAPHTLRDPDEPTTNSAYDQFPVARVGRSRRRLWITLATVVVVLGAAGAGYAVWRARGESPTHLVTDYFDDLASDDTASALALVDDGGKYADRAAYPFLDAQALAAQADRPTAVTVTATASTATADGKTATAVSVSYVVAGTTIHQTITVAAPTSSASATSGTSKPPRLVLESPFIHLIVSASGGQTAKVNGIAFPSAAKSAGVLALPGAYTGATGGNQLIAAASADAAYDSSAPDQVSATVTFPAPAAAPGATQAVQSAVNSKLTSCTHTGAPTPGNGCPFRYGDQSASMVWSITTFPQISLQIGGDGSVTFGDGGHTAVVHYEATTTGFFGFSHTDSGDAPVDVSGSVSIGGNGAITVRFNQ